MPKNLLFLFVFVFSYTTNAQNGVIWKKVPPVTVTTTGRSVLKSDTENRLFFELNDKELRQTLNTTFDKTANPKGVEIVIPNMKGNLERFRVWESSNFDAELQAKYPEIRAYAGTGISDGTATLHFSMSQNGIQTMVLRADNATEFIELDANSKKQYVLFNATDRKKGALPFTCKTEDKAINKQLFSKTAGTTANNKVFKTLKLALSCTGEYTAYHGGTVALALAAMNATMTRVNGIFNKDLAVKLNLIANNNLVIFTNPDTDPYSEVTDGAPLEWSQELETTLKNTIGAGNYDIGHLFGATGSGGNADCIGCVCDADKGRAYTSPTDGKPEGDTFDVDFVAHEFGHQLGANHTFSFEIEGSDVSVEPGSGSTIMGYAGITDYNVQNNSDDYFAYASVLQIQDNLAPKSCPTNATITNGTTTVNAGLDYTIPKGTAFKLTGIGAGPNTNAITYCWEQNDTAITTNGINSIAYATKEDGPLFRSFKPSSSPVRYFPALERVANNQLYSIWESVSSVGKLLKFTLTARDNAALGSGQTATDNMTVTVSNTAGPFAITSQNTSDITWAPASNQTITWSVNGTTNLVGSSTVNIKLSTDGGLTFPTVLASNIPNNGTAIVVVPSVLAPNCKLLIEPVANIYYAINSATFAIGYALVSACNTYNFDAPFPILESATYTTKNIVVPAGLGNIVDINLNVDFTHEDVSDIQIEIINPQGTKVRLFSNGCPQTASSLSLNFDDVGGLISCNDMLTQKVLPLTPLNVFNGLDPQGTWTLRIRDAYVSKAGTLDAASIAICTQKSTLDTPNFEIADFILSPNPNKGNFTIKFSSKSNAAVKVLVNDLLGRTIYENKFAGTSNFKEQIQLKNATSGIYLLTVLDGDRKEVKKIVVE